MGPPLFLLGLRPHVMSPQLGMRYRTSSHPISVNGLAHPPSQRFHSVKPWTDHVNHVDGVESWTILIVELTELRKWELPHLRNVTIFYKYRRHIAFL